MTETGKKILGIQAEYNDVVFRMALTHLFNIGADRLLNTDIEADCRDMIDNTPVNSILTGELQAQIHRCAYKLALIDVWEIFKFIQTDVKIQGVSAHPGFIVRFYNEECGDHITTLTLPADTDASIVDEVVENIRKFHRENPRAVRCYGVIQTTFVAAGINPIDISNMDADLTYWI